MPDLTEGALDIDYIRRVGEEIQARLFPRPRNDGRQPTPLPVSLEYQLPGGEAWPILFIPLRSVQVVDGGAPDVKASDVVVVWGHWAFAVNLTMGQEPISADVETRPRADDDESAALMALLRAVAGVL